MLRRLYIRDFVIVDALELEFASGFGALTGETGAGKSILVDALSLVLGERGDSGVVRAGRDKAEISAEFALDDAAVREWLAANDFEADSDACLLRRVIDSAGRSRAYVNGSPATLAQVRELAERLADIHGQHGHYSLLRTDAQRALLDGYAGCAELAGETAERFRAWQKAVEARLAAERDAAGLAREREGLRLQVEELSTLAFQIDSWEETNLQHRRLAHAVTLIEGAAECSQALGEGEPSARSLVERAVTRLSALCDYDASLQEALALVESAQIQLDEAAHALRLYAERLELDPERLREVEARIDAVHSVARKYRCRPEELPQLLEAAQLRLGELDRFQDLDALAAEEAALEQRYRGVAVELSAARKRAAGELSRAVTAAMQELAMPGGRFQVSLTHRSEAAAYGLEDVQYQVSANAGQPLALLSKAASGGELARIGLALQVITARAAQVPTLVFDEVDVGIGGGVAEIVGRLLQQLGQSRQVLCVTHLPQVAARADWQWSIAKEGREGQVVSRVSRLDRKGRIEEIARMLGGVKITDTTRRHAAEMLGG